MAYLPLSTANLPSPVIDPAQGASPEDYFNTVLYTGTGSQQSITGVGHDPDFVWIKKRSGADNHELTDRLRGNERRLFSSSTNAEVAGGVSFTTDGFNLLGTYGTSNESGFTYVAWNWKANGSGVTNTDGSITSTVSANTTSGFSIVSYTGNATTNATVGHGLDSAPELIIHKNRDVVDSWSVYTDAVGTGKKLLLESTSAATSTSNHPTAPTNSVFYVGAGVEVNGSGNDMLAYCFHSVEGFSKFGSYVGNGSADGPFVYTGFRPAFVMVKRSSGIGSWVIWDTKRDLSNGVGKEVYANRSDAEDTANDDIDILSNGFKVTRSATNFNLSGDTFIFMAFASNPFKYSTAF